MKKKIRFLPLFLSVLLLCATAFPASAVCYGPGQSYPVAVATSGTAYEFFGIRTYAVTTTPLPQNPDLMMPVPDASGIHDGSGTDVCIELSGGEVAIFGDEPFMGGIYHDKFVEAGENASVAYRVENPEEVIYVTIDSNVSKTQYQLYAYCNIASIHAEVREGRTLLAEQNIDCMPYTNVFYVLDY